MRLGYFALCLPLVVVTASFANGQTPSEPQGQARTDFTRIYGTEDQSIPVPTFTAPLGQRDASALEELSGYLKAVNIGEWKGLQGSGKLSDAAGADDQATLTLLGGYQFRFDVATSKGKRSTRIDDVYGKTTEVDGKSFTLPSVTAKAGLLAFSRLLTTSFPGPATSFLDRGQVKIDGQLLHRITLEEAAVESEQAPQQKDICIVDFYFDPSTHLLLKSVVSIQINSTDRQQYLVVTTYDEYQSVQGSILPFRYSQSLDGRHQWTLSLSEISFQPTVDDSYFHF